MEIKFNAPTLFTQVSTCTEKRANILFLRFFLGGVSNHFVDCVNKMRAMAWYGMT